MMNEKMEVIRNAGNKELIEMYRQQIEKAERYEIFSDKWCDCTGNAEMIAKEMLRRMEG